jgi:ABC-type polysaccharide/polyol phosphate transport system ATPase subunit
MNKIDSIPVLKVSELGKCYRVYTDSKDRIKQAFWGKRRRYYEEFWALKNITLELAQGTTLGIIGRNGSGKSTFLQLICGTLHPTTGSISVEGRIAALLELGSGFNPEFSGRENIHINASLLGLNNSQIADRAAGIIAFSELGDKIEQPVKTYSSGMFVRLAFAIACHTNPKVFIVDEALSVGDIAFQNKCMSKLREMKEEGVTLVFVSHDIGIMQMLCDQVLWLHEGEIRKYGDPISVCQDYQAFSSGGDHSPPGSIGAFLPQDETGLAHFTKAELEPNDTSMIFEPGDTLNFTMQIQAKSTLESCVFAISIYAADGEWIIGQTSLDGDVIFPGARAGESITALLRIPDLCLAPGDYAVVLGAYSADLGLCYARTSFLNRFSVRAKTPSWGRIRHPCQWILTTPQP